MKRKLLWRARKRSEANPIKKLDCGCKVWVYDNTIVRYCELHNPCKTKVDREADISFNNEGVTKGH